MHRRSYCRRYISPFHHLFPSSVITSHIVHIPCSSLSLFSCLFYFYLICSFSSLFDVIMFGGPELWWWGALANLRIWFDLKCTTLLLATAPTNFVYSMNLHQQWSHFSISHHALCDTTPLYNGCCNTWCIMQHQYNDVANWPNPVHSCTTIGTPAVYVSFIQQPTRHTHAGMQSSSGSRVRCTATKLIETSVLPQNQTNRCHCGIIWMATN